MSSCIECGKCSEEPVCTPCAKVIHHEFALELGCRNPDYHQRMADAWREARDNRLDH